MFEITFAPSINLCPLSGNRSVRTPELDVTVDAEILVVRVVPWSIPLERFVGEA